MTERDSGDHTFPIELYTTKNVGNSEIRERLEEGLFVNIAWGEDPLENVRRLREATELVNQIFSALFKDKQLNCEIKFPETDATGE